MKIEGTGAIVTGAASGMGKATATALARSGAVVAMIDRNEGGLAKAAKAIGAMPFTCDLGNSADTAGVMRRAMEAVGGARIVVGCAGIGRMEPIIGPAAVSFEQMVETVTVNLLGNLHIARLVANDLIGRAPLEDGERGVMIFVASGAAFDGPIASAAYTASKGGIVSMTLALARELGDAGIRVNTISPGAFDTPMVDNAPPEMLAIIPKTTPFPKRMGVPAEFAALAVHICENRFLNGAVIRLDGAQRMPYFSDAG